MHAFLVLSHTVPDPVDQWFPTKFKVSFAKSLREADAAGLETTLENHCNVLTSPAAPLLKWNIPQDSPHRMGVLPSILMFSKYPCIVRRDSRSPVQGCGYDPGL